MAVKIRLQRLGKKKAPWFSIVVANSRSPRDGKYIERLGTYDPTTIPATISVNNDKALEWVKKGAQPTNTVKAILKYKGVLYKKHVERGVKKGVLTLEQADSLYRDFVEKREDQIRRHREEQLNKEKRTKEARRADEVKKREAMEAKRKPVVEETPAPEAAAAAATEAATPEATQPAPEQQAAPESQPAPEQPTTPEAPPADEAPQ